ncbi:MAG: hypothetical protein AAGK33_05260 [Pseudomonadota bacterium]
MAKLLSKNLDWVGLMRLIIAILFTMTVSGANASQSWQDTISIVAKKADRLTAIGRRRGGGFLGTAYNELYVKEHSCSILGRMLGKKQHILKIEKETNIAPNSAHEFLVAGRSLANWVYNAKRILKRTRSEKIIEWNLDCAGKLGIASNEVITDLSEETFYRVDGDVLYILGDINEGFFSRLKAAYLKSPNVNSVALGSGGGDINEAMKAANFIREQKLNTTLWNNCYSACTLVFMGGVKRRIMSPYPSLMFHKASLPSGVEIPRGTGLYSMISAFVASMGGNGEKFTRYMLSSAPHQFTKAPTAELCAAKFATWVQRLCGF